MDRMLSLASSFTPTSAVMLASWHFIYIMDNAKEEWERERTQTHTHTKILFLCTYLSTLLIKERSERRNFFIHQRWMCARFFCKVSQSTTASEKFHFKLALSSPLINPIIDSSTEDVPCSIHYSPPSPLWRPASRRSCLCFPAVVSAH